MHSLCILINEQILENENNNEKLKSLIKSLIFLDNNDMCLIMGLCLFTNDFNQIYWNQIQIN